MTADAQATTQRPGHRTGHCLQLPFQSVPIASLAWLRKDRHDPFDCYEMKCLRKQERVSSTFFENDKMKGEKQNQIVKITLKHMRSRLKHEKEQAQTCLIRLNQGARFVACRAE